jgi:hypothetical protein
MKVAALVLAVLAMVSGDNVTVRASSVRLCEPLPMLVLAAELAVCMVLCWLIVPTWPAFFGLHWRSP